MEGRVSFLDNIPHLTPTENKDEGIGQPGAPRIRISNQDS